MTTTPVDTGAKPPPRKPGRVTTPLTSKVWDRAEQGELALQQCRQCGQAQFYPRSVCSHCWSADLEWTTAKGTGTIWTFTEIHKPGHAAWADEAPYPIAIVELDEGPRMTTRIVGANPDGVKVGARVRLNPDGDPPLSFVLDESPP